MKNSDKRHGQLQKRELRISLLICSTAVEAFRWHSHIFVAYTFGIDIDVPSGAGCCEVGKRLKSALKQLWRPYMLFLFINVNNHLNRNDVLAFKLQHSSVSLLKHQRWQSVNPCRHRLIQRNRGKIKVTASDQGCWKVFDNALLIASMA